MKKILLLLPVMALFVSGALCQQAYGQGTILKWDVEAYGKQKTNPERGGLLRSNPGERLSSHARQNQAGTQPQASGTQSSAAQKRISVHDRRKRQRVEVFNHRCLEGAVGRQPHR